MDISHERFGSIIHEDLDMRKLSANWVPKCLNADQNRQRCQSSEELLEFLRRYPNDFLSQLVTVDETWLYHYDPETKQQSIEWRHSGSPRPQKNPSAKIRWKTSHLDFWGLRRHPPLVIFQKVKLSTRSITYLCGFNWRACWRKNATGRSPKGSCSCTTMSRLTGHLQPRRNWPTWASGFFITHPILQIWPRWTTTCPLDWKNKRKFAISRPKRRSLLPRRPGWTDKLLNFFEWLAKVTAMD